MALYDKKRMFWIKLTETFMTGDICKFLLRQKGGSDYIVIYQMLCLKTVNKDGCLADFIGEMIIPFNEESIQQELQFFSIDTIRVALSLYKKLGLIYEESDGVLRIAEINSLVGSQTLSAAKKQIQRAKDGKKQLENKGGQGSGQKGGQMSTEKQRNERPHDRMRTCVHDDRNRTRRTWACSVQIDAVQLVAIFCLITRSHRNTVDRQIYMSNAILSGESPCT